MKIRKEYLSFISFIILLILLAGCSISKDEKVDKKEENYLLFIRDIPKEITLSFKESIEEKYDYESIDLYQDDILVFENVFFDKTKTMDNKVEIILEEYISSFNKVNISLSSGKNKLFNIGQYYLHEIEIDLYEEECQIKKSHSKMNTGVYENELLVEGPIKDIFDLVHPKMNDIGFKSNIEELKKDSRGKTFMYKGTIPLKYYEDNNLENITFDLILIHDKIDDNNKYFLGEFYIPMDYEKQISE